MTEVGPHDGPGEPAALAALTATGVPHLVTRHGPVDSLAAAAAARGVEPAAIIKTLVVRRGDGDFLLVLVPGDRGISWPKLRALLGVSRLSMPDAETARIATGYERGTITPFGALGDWPVIADERATTMAALSIGGGAHGVAFGLSGPDLLAALTGRPGGVQVADVTDPL
jgi:Cys-tRNA(Pro)/Cys-tRNA(Cys) deacylase